MKTVAIIPARGGSKGIPRKNIIDFCGRPLIAWTIAHAVQSPEVDAVYVSSDSDEILAVATKFGALPIKRPDDIAGDKATSESAIKHALGEIGEQLAPRSDERGRRSSRCHAGASAARRLGARELRAGAPHLPLGMKSGNPRSARG